ncbi:hypothetical protein A4G20_10520 [Pasteurellaceae bacterium RH1A]|nr:hypothetical protein A4G20_10520 [Pasteurellaceae bacterium RH1A]
MNLDKQQFAKQVGNTIARYRQQAGFTQEQIAEKLEIGNEAISRIERGVAMPSLVRLLEFAEIFNCRVVDLLSPNSERLQDKTDYLNSLLATVNEQERQLIAAMVEKLIEYFRSHK